MSTSFSTITPGNFELSPCRVTFGGVDLGATDKVKVKIEQKLSPLKADQLGDTDIDNKISGFKMTIETALDEIRLKNNWKVVFPNNHLITSGSNTAMYFDSQIGQSMVSLAQVLILHPLSKVNTDLSTDMYIWLATAMPSSEVDYSSTDQQKLKVTFNVYPDFTTQPPRFFLYGDPSVGLIAASAGAAIAATGNIGADTITNITVNSGATKTETISLLCVTAGGTGTGLFNVNGSMSGPLGSAKVGTSFNAFGNEIGFTIVNGSPSAATGDSYTIATTAANYV